MNSYSYFWSTNEVQKFALVLCNMLMPILCSQAIYNPLSQWSRAAEHKGRVYWCENCYKSLTFLHTVSF